MRRDELTVNMLYYVADVEQYLFTPDGVGCFWFDSFAEAFSETGLSGLITIESLED